MAAAIARDELAANPATRDWQVACAGLTVREPGAPLVPEALTALVDVGVDMPVDHKARPLTPAMCADADVIYCMTRSQRDKVIALAPDAADRTVRLDPDTDVPDPAGEALEIYRDCATRLRTLIRTRLQEHLAAPALTPSA
jgi:protein-tyrosine-phosphatase